MIEITNMIGDHLETWLCVEIQKEEDTFGVSIFSSSYFHELPAGSEIQVSKWLIITRHMYKAYKCHVIVDTNSYLCNM